MKPEYNLSYCSEIHTSDTQLENVIDNMSDGSRLDYDDGLILETSDDIHSVCQLADFVRVRMHGDRIGYILNTHIDYTNICVSKCRFCAYWRNEDDPDAYTLSPDEACDRVQDGVDEIHLVGGINPGLSLDYFVELLSTLKNRFPKAALKAFTAVELKALSDREKIDIQSLLSVLKDAGLGMLPGGGAEIFERKIRSAICPNKATADEWLDVHRTAHKLGIPSNSTMLHGHIETPEHRVDHLFRLRKLQDETGGFVAHIPLPYLHGNNELSTDAAVSNGTLDLRQIALARLILDNIPHVKSYWRVMGIRLVQTALRAGADDLDGTVGREDIMHEAGSDAPRGLTENRMRKIIEETGMMPYRRDAFHSEVEEVIN